MSKGLWRAGHSPTQSPESAVGPSKQPPPIASAPPLIRYLWMEYSRMAERVRRSKYRVPDGEVSYACPEFGKGLLKASKRIEHM
jgi:hypothetical protein